MTDRPAARALGLVASRSELAQGLADELFEGNVGMERNTSERSFRLGFAEPELDESAVGLRAHLDADGGERVTISRSVGVTKSEPARRCSFD